jgi:hypothetical protein
VTEEISPYQLLHFMVDVLRRSGRADISIELIRPEDFERVAHFERPQLVVWSNFSTGRRWPLAIVELLDLGIEALNGAALEVINEAAERQRVREEGE